MADDRLRIWETLFQRALVLIDSVGASSHGHRFSKDIDIFLPDSQWLGYLTPRLNEVAERLTTDYVEEDGSLKLRFPEGEIDAKRLGLLRELLPGCNVSAC